ncbi:MAG: YjbH domain-containing protein, partial [Alphaproteobacteria bacterium]
MTKMILRTLPLSLALIAGSAAADPASFALNGASGLIDMPTAQMLPDGETAWTFSSSETAYSGTLTFQMLPNFETSVHFTTINEWNGGALNDQSLDIKYQIFAESGNMPSLAIGFRDFLSNGALSSEYIVASKDVGHGLTVSGGLGWGRLGSNNPVLALGTRPAPSGTGVDFDHFFQGDAALFAGVEWDTPVKGLSFKAEYSSDAYTGEQDFGSFAPTSPFNFGVEYEAIRGISIGGYYNYGTDFGIRLTLSGNSRHPVVSPDLGLGPVPVSPRLIGSNRDSTWTQSELARNVIVNALAPVLAAEGMVIEEAKIAGNTIDLYVTNNNMPQTTKAIGRIARTLSVALPHSVDVFRITPVSNGVATTTVEIKRSDLEAQVERPNAGPESWRTTRFTDAPNSLGEGAWQREIDPNFTWALTPDFTISTSGTDGATDIDILLRANAQYRFSRGFAVNGGISQEVLTTRSGADTSAFAVASNGPRLDRLTADYIFKLNPSTYARVSAGYLEPRFGGVTTEVLWMPTNQNWGLGAEVSAVQQRADNDFFGFADYQTVTGHGSVYWDTGFHGLEAQVDVGRYLAGDIGSTISLSRRFDNGWEVSGFVTVTDMPFADFGNGNFAKGISVNIPLRWTLPMETRSSTGVSLGTDGFGGARLGGSGLLYPTIRDYDVVDFNETWGAFW